MIDIATAQRCTVSAAGLSSCSSLTFTESSHHWSLTPGGWMQKADIPTGSFLYAVAIRRSHAPPAGCLLKVCKLFAIH